MKPSPERTPARRKLRGKYCGGIYLSGRFREWCRERHLRPEFVAGSVAHMFAEDNATREVVIQSDYPLPDAKVYDADWLKTQTP